MRETEQESKSSVVGCVCMTHAGSSSGRQGYHLCQLYRVERLLCRQHSCRKSTQCQHGWCVDGITCPTAGFSCSRTDQIGSFGSGPFAVVNVNELQFWCTHEEDRAGVCNTYSRCACTSSSPKGACWPAAERRNNQEK